MSLQHCFSLYQQHAWTDALHALSALPENVKYSEDAIRMAFHCQVNSGKLTDAFARLSDCFEKRHGTTGMLNDLVAVTSKSGQVMAGLNKAAQLSAKLTSLTGADHGVVSVLLQHGKHSAHATLLQRICTDNTLSDTVMKQCADWLRERQFYREALTVTDEALNKATSNTLLMDKAITLRLMGRPKDAIAILARLDNAITHFAIKHNLGNAYSDMGDLSTAREYFKAAMSLNPQYFDSHINYHNINWELGETDGYGDSVVEMVEQRQAYPRSLFVLLNLLMQATYYDSALELLEKHQAHIDKAAYAYFRSKLLTLNGDYNAALDAYAMLETVTQPGPDVVIEKANALIGVGRYADAELLLTELLHQPMALREQNIAKATLNTCRRLQHAPTLERHLIREFQLETDRLAYSLDDVVSEAKVLHTAKHAPLNQSVNGGSQTRGHLFPAQTPALEWVEAFIRDKVREYLNDDSTGLRERTGLPEEHPGDIYFTGSWSVLLNGQGYHNSHYHSKAHLSGVIYLVVPDCVEEQTQKPGWLHFGMPWLNHAADISPEMEVKPVPGKLVLFPSYTWHGTNPIESGASRMTIAFDVLIR
ncbi:putative 2OG-Fe(II) oxygenase [Alteromonas sp. CYL-A6]|uniref:putative 2OG-Fe(II) oxygenase n=1 Tax=Alteromonas nitratireducens TaxID=3390813 RepID=UPI0034A8F64E